MSKWLLKIAIYSGFTHWTCLKMLIFHSYVSLPEGKSERQPDSFWRIKNIRNKTLCCLAVGCQIGQHVNIFAKERLRFCVPISSWGLQCVMCGCDGASWYHMYGCCRNHCHLWTIQLILLVWRLTHVAACRVFCLRLLMWSSSEWVDSWETVIAIAWRAVLAYTISGLLSSCACRRVNMTWTQTKSLVCRNISCLVWVRQVPGKDAKTMESKTEMELWNENQCNDKTVFLQMQEFEHGITICFGSSAKWVRSQSEEP